MTYSLPLVRPAVCITTIGAPSNGPPTLPSFARNSSMVCVFQSLISQLLGLGGDVETRRQELAGPIQRRGGFVEDRVVRLKDMRYPRHDIERNRDIRDRGCTGEPGSVVKEYLVR